MGNNNIHFSTTSELKDCLIRPKTRERKKGGKESNQKKRNRDQKKKKIKKAKISKKFK